MVGKIFLAKIYYMDNSTSKVRPVVIIKENNYEDLIVFPLTTNLKATGLLLDNDNLLIGKLPKKSLIVYTKIATIDKQFMIKEIATLKPKVFNQLLNGFCKYIKSIDS